MSRTKKTCQIPVFPLLAAFLLFQQAAPLLPQANTLRNSSSIDFSESSGHQFRTDEEVLWLEEADRLMLKLTDLDVRLYTLICRVGNEDSRKKLIKQRSLNRELIFDLLVARNTVLLGREETRRDSEGR